MADSFYAYRHTLKSFTQSDGFKNLTRIVTTLYAVLFLVNVFVKGSALTWASAILLLIIYFLGFCIMNKTNRLVIGILVILGAVLLVVYKVDVNGWLAAIRKSASKIALAALDFNGSEKKETPLPSE